MAAWGMNSASSPASICFQKTISPAPSAANCAAVRVRKGSAATPRWASVNAVFSIGLFMTHTFLLDRPDVDTASHLLGDGPVHGDNEETVLEFGTLYPHAVGKQESALELPCGDAAMQILARTLFGLPAPHDELIILPNHFQIVTRKSGHRDGDPVGLVPGLGGDPLDIVGRIAFGCPLEPVETFLERVESEKEGGGKQRYPCHRSFMSLFAKQHFDGEPSA